MIKIAPSSIWRDLIDSIKRHAVAVVLGLILLWGFFLRIYQVENQSLWIDEGFTIMTTWAVQEHGYPLLGSGEIEKKDMLLPYLLAGFDQIPGVSSDRLVFWRIIPVIAGTLSILVAFQIGKSMWGSAVGLGFAYFMSFSYWHIAWSRQARPYTLLVLFILISLYAIIRYEQSTKDRWIVISLWSMTLAALSKSAGVLLVPSLIIYLLWKRKFVLVYFVVMLSLLMIFAFRHLLYGALSVPQVNYSVYYLKGYFWGFFSVLTGCAIAGWVLAMLQREHTTKKLHSIIFIQMALGSGFFSFFVYVNQYRYVFFLTPFLFLYAAYFFYWFSAFGGQKKQKVLLMLYAMSAVGSMYLNQTAIFIPRAQYPLEVFTPQPNFKAAYQAIKKQIEANDVVVSPYPYMDRIYLGRSFYAIPISYTGRSEDVNIARTGNEYYSGTPNLLSNKKQAARDAIEQLNNHGKVYVILDAMAMGRIDKHFLAYIRNQGALVFDEHSETGQQIMVYVFSGSNKEKKDVI